MKRNNKKGFTIVELVIVIAVIAILSAVLIPTFGGIIESANQSAAIQEANAAYKEAFAKVYADGKLEDSEKTNYTGISGYTMSFDDNGVLTAIAETNGEYTFTVTNGVISIAPAANNP